MVGRGRQLRCSGGKTLPEDNKGSHLNIWSWNVLSQGKSKTKAFKLEYTWHTEGHCGWGPEREVWELRSEVVVPHDKGPWRSG